MEVMVLAIALIVLLVAIVRFSTGLAIHRKMDEVAAPITAWEDIHLPREEVARKRAQSRKQLRGFAVQQLIVWNAIFPAAASYIVWFQQKYDLVQSIMLALAYLACCTTSVSLWRANREPNDRKEE